MQIPVPVSLSVKWLDIHTRVRKMIRSVFEAAAVTHPEMHSPTSRAMYGVDVMLDSSFQPKLLEVCKRSNGPFPMLLSIPKVLSPNCHMLNDLFRMYFLC